MLKWIPFAMVRVTLFFVTGVLLGIYQPQLMPLWIAGLAFWLLAIFFFVSAFKLKVGFVNGLVGLSAVFFAGYIHLSNSVESHHHNHLVNVKEKVIAYCATVVRPVEEKQNSWLAVVQANKVLTQNGWTSVRGKVNLYVSKKNFETPLFVGSKVLINGQPNETEPPRNPHEFDYKRFLSFRNIYHQQFVQASQIYAIHGGDEKGFLHYSSKIRSGIVEIINRYIHGEQERAIVLALVIGVTDGLDNELTNAYAASGAMHVLSVSGLHVGIIYLIILFLFRPLKDNAKSRWILASVSLLCLWGYAFITGLSPSVLRAVTMFSFIAVARPFGLKSNIYNTLAASAFLLLLYDPFLIMSVGFQLSYLAVLGIVWLQPPLYNLWSPSNLILDNAWKITCVSVAAQLATFALGLLYFHQFPTYFLFSNFFVIPASFIILVLGIVLVAVSFIPLLAQGVGWILEMCAKLLNAGVFAVEDLPFSLINGIYFTTAECWMIMGIFTFVILSFQRKKISWLIASSFLAVTFSLGRLSHFIGYASSSHWIVYSIRGHSAFEFVERGHSYFYADSLLSADAERIRFHVKPNRLFSQVDYVYENSGTSLTEPAGSYRSFHWKGKSIAVLNEFKGDFPEGLAVDYLVVGQGTRFPGQIDCGLVILDSSFSYYEHEQAKKRLGEMGLPFYSVLDQGAFVLKDI